MVEVELHQTRHSKMEELKVLGSQTLLDLRRALYCVTGEEPPKRIISHKSLASSYSPWQGPLIFELNLTLQVGENIFDQMATLGPIRWHFFSSPAPLPGCQDLF